MRKNKRVASCEEAKVREGLMNLIVVVQIEEQAAHSRFSDLVGGKLRMLGFSMCSISIRATDSFERRV